MHCISTPNKLSLTNISSSESVEQLTHLEQMESRKNNVSETVAVYGDDDHRRKIKKLPPLSPKRDSPHHAYHRYLKRFGLMVSDQSYHTNTCSFLVPSYGFAGTTFLVHLCGMTNDACCPMFACDDDDPSGTVHHKRQTSTEGRRRGLVLPLPSWWT